MENFIALFYVGPYQAVPVIVGLVLWIGLAGLGYLVTGRDRITEANVFFGWAAVSSVFTIVGVVLPGTFLILSILAALLAVAGIALAWKKGDVLFVRGSWRVGVLALPLLFIAGAMEPSQWDEFSHWLPAPQYLLAFDGFPTGARPNNGPEMLPAYPYGWPFLHYLSARIAGGFINNIGGILNLLMLLTFAQFVLRTAFAIVGHSRADKTTWSFAAAAALIATAFNPTFVQKIVLTAYSDVSSAVMTGVALLVGYHVLERLAVRDHKSVAGGAWQLALALMLLINIRQPNLIVVLAILLALGLVAWRDPDISLFKFATVAVFALLATLAIYGAWRWYVAIEFSSTAGAEATLMPFALWNIEAIPKILVAMLGVAFKKVAFFGPMAFAVVFAVRGLVWCRTGFDRIAILTGTVFVIYTSFLTFIYVAHFALPNALSVVSYWRYNIDVGMIAVIFGVVGALMLLRRHRLLDSFPRWLSGLAIATVLVLPAAFVEKVRFDLEPPKPFFTKVAKDMATLGLTGQHYVLDPTGTGESAVITRNYLGQSGKPWLAAFNNTSPEAIANFVAQVAPGNFLLVHSIMPGAAEALNRQLDGRRSYLFRREADGWILVRDWEKPADHPW